MPTDYEATMLAQMIANAMEVNRLEHYTVTWRGATSLRLTDDYGHQYEVTVKRVEQDFQPI